jgi:hypothetical protein
VNGNNEEVEKLSKKGKVTSPKVTEADIRKRFKLETVTDMPTIRREFKTLSSVAVRDFLESGKKYQKLTIGDINDDKELRGQVDAIRRYVRLSKLSVSVHKIGAEVYLEREMEVSTGERP